MVRFMLTEGKKTLLEVYRLNQEDFSEKPSTPALFDKKLGRVTHNESEDLLILFDSGLNSVAKHPTVNLTPPPLKEEIERLGERVYNALNDGVYQAGFATAQSVHDEVVRCAHPPNRFQ